MKFNNELTLDVACELILSEEEFPIWLNDAALWMGFHNYNQAKDNLLRLPFMFKNVASSIASKGFDGQDVELFMTLECFLIWSDLVLTVKSANARKTIKEAQQKLRREYLGFARRAFERSVKEGGN